MNLTVNPKNKSVQEILEIDFEYHNTMKEMYPSVFDLHVVQDIVSFYKFSF